MGGTHGVDVTNNSYFASYRQGTSMASPHVVGVAALVVADPQACPDTLPAGYLAFPGTNSDATQSCTGGPGHNSWYGTGQADAFNAVTHASGSGG